MADRFELSAELMTRIGWYYDPVLATGAITLGIVSILIDAGAVVAFCYFFFGALLLLRWRWVLAGLKRIAIEGDALYMSDYLGRRGAVHLVSVSDVSEIVFPLGRIKLSLDVDTRFGRIVEFRPKGWKSGPWRPHPMATYLQERIAAARVGIPPRLPAQQYAEKYLELQADMRRLRETEDQEHDRRML